MTRSEHDDYEMDRAEDWFGDVCDEPGIGSLDAIKLRVRIEAGEQWLAEVLRDDAPDHLITTMKRSVRQSLNEESQPQHIAARKVVDRPTSPSRRILTYFGLASLAAAASIVALVTVYQPVESASVLSLGDAFEAFRTTDVDLALDEVADDLSDLELAFYEGADPQWEDAQIDDLRQSIGTIQWDDVVDDDRS